MRPNTGSGKRVLNQRGLTAVELIIVVGIILVVSALAMPAISRALVQARVASIIADFRVVEAAATDYYLENDRWPAERSQGEAPPEMVEYLQEQFDWSSPFVYDWENLIGANGQPTQPESGIAIGFAVRTTDAVVLQLLKNSWDGPLYETQGFGVTFTIEPL